MPQTLTHLRVVLASPMDVKGERNAFAELLEAVNEDTARPARYQLELYRWETDASPGFHPLGPQGIVDHSLRIEDCDLFVGILWNRIGTPTSDGRTGTEHEFDTAYRSWTSAKRPKIMFYFNQRASTLKKDEDLDQRKRVIAFQHDFPKEGMYAAYNGRAEFVKQVSRDLRRFVREHTADNGTGGSRRLKGLQAAPSTASFAVEVDRKGSVQIPVDMMTVLRLNEGDILRFAIAGSEIESVAILNGRSRFRKDVIGLLNKRRRSGAVSIASADVKVRPRKVK